MINAVNVAMTECCYSKSKIGINPLLAQIKNYSKLAAFNICMWLNSHGYNSVVGINKLN